MAAPSPRARWLIGPDAPCSPRTQPERPVRLVLLGAPGVGKGTQASLLSEALGACHLSTGDLLRAAADAPPHRRTRSADAAVSAMARGALVSDAIVLALVRERTGCLACGTGFLLDGFPRTLPQARALDALLGRVQAPLDAVVRYELPATTIVARLAGRRICCGCGAVYHVELRPPAASGICDRCGGSLTRRPDDQPQAVSARLVAYEKETAPLVRYYAHQGLLLVVSAAGTAADVCARTIAALNAAGRISVAAR